MNVIVAKSNILYKETIDIKKLTFKKIDKLKKKCKPISLKYLENKKFIAAHYINKGSVICERSLTGYKKQSVVFDFGTIEIEKNAKVLNENEEFILIKNRNGKREKIYKNGLSQ